MEYKTNEGILIQEGAWNERTCIRRQGGYNLSTDNLPSSLQYLPKGAVLAYDTETETASVVKSVKLYEAASSGATEIKVEKNSAVAVGDVVGGVTISAIDTTNDDYDVLTVSGVSADLESGTGLVEDVSKKTIIGLNYATVKIDANPSVTATVQAYDIDEDSLPYPVNDEIKEALTVRHAWKV